MRHGSQRGLREKSSVRHQAKLLLLALPPLLLLHWKEEKKNGTPSFSSYLLTIVFLLLQHGGLINEKIVQYGIEVPIMDGLSKTFLFFIQILMTLMKLGGINVE